MKIQVRPATEVDYPVAGAVCVAAYRADGQLAAEPVAGEYDYSVSLADVAGRAAHSDVLVAEDTETGEIVGTVTFVRPSSPMAELAGPEESEFRMLAVAPGAWGNGVGAALVRACVDAATADGDAALVICVREFNETAKRLYARHGFTRTPERDFTPVPGIRLEALRLPLR